MAQPGLMSHETAAAVPHAFSMAVKKLHILNSNTFLVLDALAIKIFI